jgi:hypothetical protein
MNRDWINKMVADIQAQLDTTFPDGGKWISVNISREHAEALVTHLTPGQPSARLRASTTQEAAAMWTIKRFKTFKAQSEWIEANQHRYQIQVVIVNNGYAVEYRKLVTPRNPR